MVSDVMLFVMFIPQVDRHIRHVPAGHQRREARVSNVHVTGLTRVVGIETAIRCVLQYRFVVISIMLYRFIMSCTMFYRYVVSRTMLFRFLVELALCCSGLLLLVIRCILYHAGLRRLIYINVVYVCCALYYVVYM